MATIPERQSPRLWARHIRALWLVGALGVVVVSGVVAALVLGRHATPSARRNAIAAQGVFITRWTIPFEQSSAATVVTVTALAPSTGAVRWQHREAWSPYHLLVHAVVVPGVVYLLGDHDFSADFAHPGSSTLLAVRASDGSQLWRLDVGAWASQPVVDMEGDTIYISAERVVGARAFAKVVYAVNARDGSVRWHTELAHTGMATDSLSLSRGRLFLGASEFLCSTPCILGDLFALDARDGQLMWHQPIAGRLPFAAAAPAVDDDVVYYPGPQVDGLLPTADIFAYSARDGHALWHDDTAMGEDAYGFVVIQGTVYAAAFKGTDPSRSYVGIYSVVALDGATGAQRWRMPITPTQQVVRLHVLALQGSQLYIQTEAEQVVAGKGAVADDETLTVLDRTSGQLLWQAPLGPIGVSLLVGDGLVYVSQPPAHALGQATLLGLNGVDGSQRWKVLVDASAELWSSYAPTPAVTSGGLVFLRAFDYTHLYVDAVQASDGQLRWRFTVAVGHLASIQTIISDIATL